MKYIDENHIVQTPISGISVGKAKLIILARKLYAFLKVI
jgi:hypothetical protein